MADIQMGNVYDWNKNRVNMLPALSASALSQAIKDLKIFMSNTNNTYYMLLCRELNDYTIFKTNKTPDGNTYNATVLIQEILNNRGYIKEFSNNDNASYDCWITKEENGKNESYVYMFFPCDGFVIDEV